MSEICVMSDALISPGPVASRINFFGSSVRLLSAKDFMFRTMSVTSSLTPFIEVNSWRTPSIWIAVTAAPWIDDNNILLKEFPIVWPKPFSKAPLSLLLQFYRHYL